MTTRYFKDCATMDQARQRRAELAKEHHPDKGGSAEIMKEINRQYDEFMPQQQAWGESMFGGRPRYTFTYAHIFGDLYREPPPGHQTYHTQSDSYNEREYLNEQIKNLTQEWKKELSKNRILKKDMEDCKELLRLIDKDCKALKINNLELSSENARLKKELECMEKNCGLWLKLKKLWRKKNG